MTHPRPGAFVRVPDGRHGVVQPYTRHDARPWVPVAREDGVHLIYLLLELTEVDPASETHREAS
jgi:hypothetical protein